MKTNKPKLEYTEDYNIFEMHELNRTLHAPILEALEKSMEKWGFWPSEPISCKRNGGKTLKIVKGHHRFATAKKLGIGVYYIVDDTPCTIFEREGHRGQEWNGQDFLHAYASNGNKEYLALLRFIKKHKIKLGAAASLAGGESAGSNNKVRFVKSGEFKMGDMAHANAVCAITDFCLEAGYDFGSTTPFVSAVSMVVRIPEYEPQRMMDSLAKFGHKMRKRSTKFDYLQEIESVYNGGRVKRVPIAFRAVEVSKERHMTFGRSNNPS